MHSSFRWLGLAVALLTVAPAALAQVGVGTTTPNARAALDISATDKGLLIPRLTQAQRSALTSVPDGLMVFQTDNTTGFWYYFGGAWTSIPNAATAGDNLGNHTATQALNLQANALTGTGSSIGAAVGLGVRADGGLNLGQNTNGNLFIGYQAGQSISFGWANLFIGYLAGYSNTMGNANLFSGYKAGYANTSGSDNLFSGYLSGYSNTTGSHNLFSGTQSGYANTTGSRNHFSGTQSGYFNTTGSNNLFSGFNSGLNNTTGSYNLFSGFNSGFSNTTGSNNVFSGASSGYYNTTGSNNVFSGFQSGVYNTTGNDNHFSGYNSGLLNTTGSNNVFSGYNSGFYNTTGSNNVFSGFQSGVYNTTGSDNHFSGFNSGVYNTTGSNNLFVGSNAGQGNVTGSNNTALGYQAGPTTGALTNATALGYKAQVSQSNSLVLGGTGADAVKVGIGTTAPQAPLHVSGGASLAPNNTTLSYFGKTGGFQNAAASGATARGVVAYFEGGELWVNNTIVAGQLNVSSDRRIKRVLGLSNQQADLALLQRLRITDYTYIDQVAHTDQVVKKVVAQEVAQVLPAAVSRSTQAIPNVYEEARQVRFADGYVTVTTARPHELPAGGGAMRLYTAAHQSLSVAAEAVDAHTFRYASPEAGPEALFVYGKVVDDFLSVDYDALTTLNVSATQELARQVEHLTQLLETQAHRLDQQQASLQRLQAQVEASGGPAVPAATARR